MEIAYSNYAVRASGMTLRPIDEDRWKVIEAAGMAANEHITDILKNEKGQIDGNEYSHVALDIVYSLLRMVHEIQKIPQPNQIVIRIPDGAEVPPQRAQKIGELVIRAHDAMLIGLASPTGMMDINEQQLAILLFDERARQMLELAENALIDTSSDDIFKIVSER